METRRFISGDIPVVLMIVFMAASPAYAQPPATGPAISLSAPGLEFNPTPLGASAQRILTITNTGNASLTVTSIELRGNILDFRFSPTSGTVAPGQGLRVTVTFEPTSAGYKSASLKITHSASQDPLYVNVFGTGTVQMSGVPLAPVSPSFEVVYNPIAYPHLTFGGGRVTLAFPETAVGSTLRLAVPVRSAASTGFGIEGVDASQFTVSPPIPNAGAYQEFRVTFAPTSAGDKSATLFISHNDTNPGAINPYLILIKGTGVKGPSPDFNGDGEVGLDDLFLFTDVFGKRQGDVGFDAKFDLNGDGAVDLDDFFVFAEGFGKKI